MITQTQPREGATSIPAERRAFAVLRTYWLPIGITGLVLLGALVGPSALTTVATAEPATGVRLDVGWGYLLMAPVANVLDTLSVLTLAQHYAVLATLLLAYTAWRLLRPRRPRTFGRRVAVEAGAALLSLLGLAAFYAYGIVGPRPMAALAPGDEDIVVVDVHSHTDHSHDGRDGFDADDNRAWHAAAGFDAVYVSDHRTWQGYAEGQPDNPRRAGDGTVLLPGLEIKYAGKYASALGEPWQYRAAVESNHLVADTLYRLFRETGVRPTLVLTIPSRLDGVVASTPDTLGFVAVELSDASPRGLQQSRRDRALLLRMTDSLDLAPVAASNNHGWGRTAAAWTLMRIPGWRDMTPRQLGQSIESKLHRERRDASWVVERRVPWAGDHPLALASTGPAIVWNMFGGMSAAERVSWIAWTWALALLLLGTPTSGRPPSPLRRSVRSGSPRLARAREAREPSA